MRHCEPAEDMRGRCYGSLDVGLSDAGRAHARELVARVDGSVVWTSPRLRARETAAALSNDAHVDDDLRELDFGDFEGRAYDEIATSEPEIYRAWMETPTRVRFPGGESWDDLKTRTLRSFARIETDVVAVTHGGVIRAALSAWLGIPDEAIFRVDVPYGGVTVVDFIGGTPIVRMVNG